MCWCCRHRFNPTKCSCRGTSMTSCHRLSKGTSWEMHFIFAEMLIRQRGGENQGLTLLLSSTSQPGPVSLQCWQLSPWFLPIHAERCWSRAEQEGGCGGYSPTAGFSFFCRPLGFGGLHAPSFEPCSLRRADRYSHGFQEANAPSGRQPEEGRAGTSRGVWKGRPALGNSLSSNGRAGAVWFPASCHGPSPGGSLSSFEMVIL